MTRSFDVLAEAGGKGARAALKGLMLEIWRGSKGEFRIRILIAIVALIASKLVNLGVPFLYKGAVDALGPERLGVVGVPFALISAYAGARVMAQVFNELRDFLFARVSFRAQHLAGLAAFEHLHALSLRFHLERQTGGLSRVIERGTHGIQFVLHFLLFNIIPTAIEMILVTGVLFAVFGWEFALLTFATIAVYVVYTIAISNWRTEHRKLMNQKDTEAHTRAIDSLLNYETVKIFSNEPHERARFDESLEEVENAAVRSQTSLSLLNVGQAAIIGSGLFGVMTLAADGISQNVLTVGDFVLVNTYLIQLSIPLNFLGFMYREIRQGLVDMEKMFELLAVKPEVADRSGAQELLVIGGGIEFRDVGFSYGNGRKILDGVSFTVPTGKSVAVVGASGSGKSTIARLLLRFFDVESGSICINGQDIRELKQDSLRKAIGVVPQDTVLFNDTIAYNIRYGRPGASDSELIEVAHLARIHGLIESLPEKYEALVGERGLKLSGGEKQRVAIARMLLKHPRIFIFDEATSALDSHTEKEIQASLREVSRNRTAIVIAHRLSTIVDADEILVLEKGKIIERGRHSSLLSRQGVYAALWARQEQAALFRDQLELEALQ